MDGSGSSSKRLIVALACGALRTAAAEATFSDSTGAAIGTETRAAPRHDLVAETGASLPITSAILPAQSIASGSSPPRGTAGTVRTPPAPRQARAEAVSIPVMTGSRSALPMLPRTAFHENGCRRAAHECAGDAAGFRDPEDRADIAWLLNIDDDKHEGEVAAHRSLGSLAGRATIAAMPDGVFTGLNASNTSSDVSITSTPSRASALQDGLAIGAQARRGDRDDLERQTGCMCILHEVGAVEQHMCAAVAAASAAARNRDTSGFCRLVMIFTCGRLRRASARFHMHSLNSAMKDRIMKRFNEEIAALERELKVDLPKEIQRARASATYARTPNTRRPRTGRTSSTPASPC